MLAERGVEVDHSTLNRWVVKYVDQEFRARKRPVGASWLDDTYVKVKGSWKYLYRAVDKAGATVDFPLTAKRDRKAALRFLRKAIGQHGVPKKITIDKSGANTAAIESYNAEHEADIEIRQNKFLNNIVKQDHRAVKRVTRPMLGVQDLSISYGNPGGGRAHAHDPKGAVAGDGRIASSAAILLAGDVNLVVVPRPTSTAHKIRDETCRGALPPRCVFHCHDKNRGRSPRV